MRRKVSEEERRMVAELRGKGYKRKEIAQLMGVPVRHIIYILLRLSKCSTHPKSSTHPIWYRKERLTQTDTIPNPFPKWWCEKNGLSHNFYRPRWRDQ